MHADGGGLYLQVSGTGSKSWIYRFMLNGRARNMGLGPLHTISLAEARQAALQCRKLCHEGRYPIEERKARLAPATSSYKPTFMKCAEAYIAAHQVGVAEP